MKIHVTAGTGCATTELGAFDRALYEAGIANLNLIKLSSVIPAGAELVVTDPKTYRAEGCWGDRLYVVMAESRTSVPDETVCAGIGWSYDSSGRGLFVGVEGTSEQYVRDSITHSLKDLAETRGIDAVETDMVLSSSSYEDAPVCALVAAVYQSEPW